MQASTGSFLGMLKGFSRREEETTQSEPLSREQGLVERANWVPSFWQGMGMGPEAAVPEAPVPSNHGPGGRQALSPVFSAEDGVLSSTRIADMEDTFRLQVSKRLAELEEDEQSGQVPKQEIQERKTPLNRLKNRLR